MIDYKLHEEVKTQFLKKYPKLFKDIHPANFDLPFGWIPICNELFKKLDEFDVQIFQVKQKMSTLRVYLERESLRGINENGQAEIYAIVTDAEQEALQTCEWCGESPAKSFDGGYISRSCDSCIEEIKKKWKKQ